MALEPSACRVTVPWASDRLTGGPIGARLWDSAVEDGVFYAGSHEDNPMIEHDRAVGSVRRREVYL
jgi:hypothetical protein